MATDRRYALVLNRAAGRGAPRDHGGRLCAILEARGLRVVPLHARRGAEVPLLARQAAAGGYRAVIAAGGDGTVHAVAEALLGRDIPLGVLPCGTLNHFARDLGVPLDLEGAADVIAAGRVARVDVGRVNGQPFLNNAQLGLYAAAVALGQERARRLGWRRWPALLAAAGTMLYRHPRLHVRAAANGALVERDASLFLVGNNRYRGRGRRLLRRPHLDEGVLDVHVAATRSLGDLAGLAARAVRGKLDPDERYLHVTAPAVSVTSPVPTLRLSLDGELVLLHPPLSFRVDPLALPVFAP